MPQTDPMASEVSRSGEFYFFSGAINGIPVTFRINEAVNGIRIPLPIATASHAVPKQIKLPKDPSTEIVAPVSTILFGAYPIKAVMAKIIVSEENQYVDVGLDALTNFKVKNVGGRRLLTRG